MHSAYDTDVTHQLQHTSNTAHYLSHCSKPEGADLVSITIWHAAVTSLMLTSNIFAIAKTSLCQQYMLNTFVTAESSLSCRL